MISFKQVYEDLRWISRLVTHDLNDENPFRHEQIILLRKKMEEKESLFVAEVDGCAPSADSYKKIFNIQTINLVIPMEKLQGHLQEIYDSLVREASVQRNTFRELFPSFDNAGEIVFVDCSESSTYIKKLFPKLDEYCENYVMTIEKPDRGGVILFRSFALKRARAMEKEKAKNHMLNCIQCVSNIQTYINVVVSLEQIWDQLVFLSKIQNENENTSASKDSSDDHPPQLSVDKPDALEEISDEVENMEFPLQF